MGMRRRVGFGRAAALAAGVLVGSFAGVAPPRPAAAEDPPQGPSTPLPLTGRQTVRAGGKTYVIDGKQVVPRDAIIRVEANVRIVGINKASLEVQGGFLVHGTQDCWVHIENVDFSPTVSPENAVHFDMADLYGCTFVHGETAAYDGGLTIENSCWQGECKFAVRIRSGYLRIMTTEFKMPCVVDARPEKGQAPEVAIRTAWMKDVTLSGNAAAVVRDSEVRGTLVGHDFTDLIVDGVDLFGDASFKQPGAGSFSKLQLIKCNLFGGLLTLARPAGDGIAMEKVRVEKFHFGTADAADMTDKAIAARIVDGGDDEKVSVKAFWQNPQARRHFFLSPTLRKRAPP